MTTKQAESSIVKIDKQVYFMMNICGWINVIYGSIQLLISLNPNFDIIFRLISLVPILFGTFIIYRNWKFKVETWDNLDTLTFLSLDNIILGFLPVTLIILYVRHLRKKSIKLVQKIQVIRKKKRGHAIQHIPFLVVFIWCVSQQV